MKRCIGRIERAETVPLMTLGGAYRPVTYILMTCSPREMLVHGDFIAQTVRS